MLFSRNNFNKRWRFSGAGKRRFVYSKRTYANPFFRRKKVTLASPNGWLSNRIKLTILAALTAILILVWLLFFSTLFKINQIEVSGVGENLAKEVKSLALEVAENRLVGKNNLLLYDKSELARVLNDKYYLQNLSIARKLFHTLKIILEEKSQTAVWREDDKYFYLDSEGNIINQVDSLNINSSQLPLIEKKHGFEIERFILDRDINTIKMAVLSGPRIYFNLAGTVANQAARLDLIIKEKLKNNFATKEYIDLRYGNNVYIK